MMELEVFGESAAMATVAELLDGADGTHRVMQVDATRARALRRLGRRAPGALDALLEDLRRLDVPDSDITVTRVEVVDWSATRSSEATFVWADVLGQAWLNARPFARYLALMFIAGVIASYGVVDSNVILIVGAMAVSPDLLPITAMGVSIVGRRPRLGIEAFLTLALGLGVAGAAAALFAFGQHELDLLPSGFDIHASSTALGGLTHVNNETIAVAFVAGIAGMLALETRASSSVGVAVSVTTIPASAYIGVATGVGEFDTVGGALGVLGTNILMMALGASSALAVQRVLKRRAAARRRASA